MRRILRGLVMVFALVGIMTVLCGCGQNDVATGSNAATSGDTSGDTQAKVLRVGMECAYAPYNWAQSDDSNGAVPIKGSTDFAYGYDVMMAKFLAEKMGYELEVHKIDWDSLPIALMSDKIDCVIAGQSITAERLQTVDFTTPYYYASIVGLVNKDGAYANAQGIEDLAGATCTSQINTVWYDVCLPQIENANILPAMELTSAMLVALDSGKAELVVTDMPTAMAATQVYPNMTILDFTNTSGDNFEVSDEEINIGISVKKGNADLLAELNTALAELDVTDFEEMMNTAISVQPLAQ